jgi:hypothetical protein
MVIIFIFKQVFHLIPLIERKQSLEFNKFGTIYS